MAAPSCGEHLPAGRRHEAESADQNEHASTSSETARPGDTKREIRPSMTFIREAKDHRRLMAWQGSVWYLSSPSTPTPPTLTILLSLFPISARLFFNRAS